MPLPAGHAAGWVDGEGLIDTGLLFFQRISGNWVVVNETIGIQMGKHRKAQRFMGIPPDGFLKLLQSAEKDFFGLIGKLPVKPEYRFGAIIVEVWYLFIR